MRLADLNILQLEAFKKKKNQARVTFYYFILKFKKIYLNFSWTSDSQIIPHSVNCRSNKNFFLKEKSKSTIRKFLIKLFLIYIINGHSPFSTYRWFQRSLLPMQVNNHLVQHVLHLLLGVSAVSGVEQLERLLLEGVVRGEPEDAGQGGAHVQTEFGPVLLGRLHLRLDAVLAVCGGVKITTLGLHLDTRTTRIDVTAFLENMLHNSPASFSVHAVNFPPASLSSWVQNGGNLNQVYFPPFQYTSISHTITYSVILYTFVSAITRASYL